MVAHAKIHKASGETKHLTTVANNDASEAPAMTGERALELVKALNDAKKKDVFNVLEMFGVTMNTRGRNDYTEIDATIIRLLTENKQGLNSKSIRFLAAEAGVEIDTTTAAVRLKHLIDAEKVVFNKAMGLYAAVAGK